MALLCCYSMFMGLVAVVVVTVIVLPVIVTTIATVRQWAPDMCRNHAGHYTQNINPCCDLVRQVFFFFLTGLGRLSLAQNIIACKW